METIRIEPMTVDDVPRVFELERACFPTPWDIDAYYGELRNPAAYYLVARTEAETVGFGGMWAVEDVAHVMTLAVDPAARRQGIGRQLLAGLLAEARRRGVTEVSLEVRVGNVPALGLYTSFGFRRVGVRKRYYPDNNEDAAVMVLELAPEA